MWLPKAMSSATPIVSWINGVTVKHGGDIMRGFSCPNRSDSELSSSSSLVFLAFIPSVYPVRTPNIIFAPLLMVCSWMSSGMEIPAQK